MKNRQHNNVLRSGGRGGRTIVVGFLFCACLAGLIFQIWRIQYVYGEEYTLRVVRTVARENQLRARREIMPSRGGIYDRNMLPIATSQPVYNIFIDVTLLHGMRQTVSGREEWERTLSYLIDELDIPRRELVALFDTDSGIYSGNLLRRTNHQYVAWQVPAAIAIPLRTEFQHVHTTEISQRFHHDPFFAPQVIGFRRGDAIHGLEHMYDAQLTGEMGQNFWIQGEIEEIPVQDGLTLITTLDSEIQRLAQSIVEEAYRTIEFNPEAVGMIVMEPFTGEILAMAQAPSFSLADPLNPSYLSDPWLRANWDYMYENERLDEMQRFWNNFHLRHTYEPGSIFKPFVMAAAIEEGVVSPYDTFFCNRLRYVSDAPIWCWAAHGTLTFRGALYRSCNHAMIDIINRLGRDTFYRYRGYFGFGERTGIDLPNEHSVSNPYLMYTRPRLGVVQLATSSIGQGFNVTTLQAITGFAALINGGNLMQPIVVSHVIDANGNVVYENRPQVVRRVISQTTSDFMRSEMRHVVTSDHGTGRQSRIPYHSIGGKTGTGQQGVRAARINSLTYISFMPVENPEFLVLMVADRVYDPNERASAGGTVAPFVRRFYEDLIRIRNMPPSYGDHDMSSWEERMGADIMPDFSGLRLSDVVRSLPHLTTGGFDVIGSGTHISHTSQPAGGLMPRNSPIFFHMDISTRNEELITSVPDIVGQTAERAASILNNAGLQVTLSTAQPPPTRANDEEFPRTFGPGDPSTYYENGFIPPPPEPLPYTVYMQFPSAGSEIERGTTVVIRAR